MSYRYQCVNKRSDVVFVGFVNVNLYSSILPDNFRAPYIFFWQKMKFLPSTEVDFSCRINHDPHVFTSDKMVFNSFHIEEVRIRSPEK